jgi:4'-phosphopantetheinyl transferase
MANPSVAFKQARPVANSGRWIQSSPSMLKVLYPPGPSDPNPAREDLHIWAVELDACAEAIDCGRDVLSDEERERADRFRFEKHRNRFTIGRACLRQILSRYLGEPAASLSFEHGPNGKPRLAGGFNGLQFNLAHSETLALVAVTQIGEVGVDVEEVRVLPDFDELVSRFFSARETAAFEQLSEEEKPAAFFNLWTRKEAFLKATGEGIGHGLNRVEVSFLAGEAARFAQLPEDLAVGKNWILRELAPADGFVGAVTVGGEIKRLECWRFKATTNNEHSG